MSKVYNTQGNLATNLNNFLSSICPFLTKNYLNILPHIIVGMIDAESVTTFDIAKKLKNFYFENTLNESVNKRIWRFFNNKNFDIYSVYDSIIKHIISNYTVKHGDNRIHISFDHMYCKNKFTILAFSLRINRQGIPIWFKAFEGKDDPNAFTHDLIKEGIDYVHNLFKDKNCNLIFLADRWFNDTLIMKHISSLGHSFNIRVKTNIKVLIHDKKEGHKVWKFISDIKPFVYHSKIFNDIIYTEEHQYILNLVVSKSDAHKEPWHIVTNADPKRAIKDYSYRFGSIESIFKNNKSNGFYLETTNVKNLHAFSTMYGIANIALIWLVILGADYSKNKHHKKNLIIRDTKVINKSPKRILSLFNLGLTIFNLAYNSFNDIKLKFNFILYDS